MAALALAGVAVFSVHQAGCADPGRYVQRDDGQLELVDGCVDPAQLPPAKQSPRKHKEPAAPAINELTGDDAAAP